MTKFQKERKIKLSAYKIDNLTKEKGKWRTSLYDHILPIDQKEKNIIAPIRDDFWSYFKASNIKLHSYFHHLNSSQALCFNLFFPLFHFDKRFLSYVLTDLMEIKNGDIEKCEFEKILCRKERTNFDFFIEHSNNKRILFEIKYTEDKFNKTSKSKDATRYEKIYEPQLKKILKPEFLNQKFVFNNYQIVRNLSYVDENTTVVFLFPEANLNLKNTEKLISDIILPNHINRVKTIYVENLTSQILKSEYLIELHHIFETFRRIYVD